jgi:dTDP-4-dehydrorhamnose reductase
MKILLLGKNGQLGWELQRALSPLGEVTAVDLPEVDFVDESAIRKLVRRIKPTVIVNSAAYTSVDRAESESDIAWAINGIAPGILAEEALDLQAGLIHFSTDYVFDGTTGKAYVEDDHPNPLNVYGKSKLAGDQAIQQVGKAFLIIRTSWVYSTRQGGFVNKVLQWARQQSILRIVSDQVSNPTWCRMLAEAIAQVLVMGKQNIYFWLDERKGIYHLTGAGSASRFEWAKAILDLDPRRNEQIVEDLRPALTAEFPTPAIRPLYTPLCSERFYDTFGLWLPGWRETLELAMSLG